MQFSKPFKGFLAAAFVTCAALLAPSLPIYVPAIDRLSESTLKMSVPPYFLNEYKSQWDSIKHQLVDTNAKHIILYWNGGGGIVSMGDDFIKYVLAAERQGKTVQLIITNTAISEHAMVICDASSYVMTQGATLHYHAMFYRWFGKKVYTDTQSRWQDCMAKRILTPEEVSLIVNNHRRIVVMSDGTHVIADDWSMEEFVATSVADRTVGVKP